MKNILTIITLILSVTAYSQVTLRKGYVSMQSSDTVWMTYSNGEWTLESDTVLTLSIDTLYFSDGSKYSTATGGAAVDSFYVLGQNEWIEDKDTIRKVDTAVYVISVLGDTLFYNYAVKFTGESGTYIDSNGVTLDSVIVGSESYIFEENNDLYISTESGTHRIMMGDQWAGGVYMYSDQLVRGYVDGGGGDNSSYAASTVGGVEYFSASTSNSGYATRLDLFDSLMFYRIENDTIYKADATGFYATNITANNSVTTDTLVLNGAEITDTIDLKSALEAESFSEFNFDTATYVTQSEGRLHYDESTRSLVFQNDISDFNHNLGYEFVRRVYNGTASTIPNGRAVRRVGTYSNGDIIASVALAGNSTLDSSVVYGITTVDIAPGAIGIVTRGGDVRGLNTSGLNDTTAILGHAGVIIDTVPEPPYFYTKLGDIIYSDNDSGLVDVDISDPVYYPNPIFSAYFSDSSITITNPGQNVYENITNATNAAFIERRNIGFTFQGDSVSPKQDGNYTIFYSYSFQGDATVSDLWRIGTFVNAVEIYSTSRTSSSTNNGGVPYPVSTYLNAGDWVSFRVTNTGSATRDCVFIDSSIAINYSE